MTLNLLKRSEAGAALTTSQHDSNFTAIEDEVNAKALAANPVFTGTVTIPDGALAIADTNGLQAALDEKLDEPGGEAAAASYIDGLSGVHDATTVLLGNNTFGAPPGGGGGGGLTTELDANTAITVGSGTDGEHHVLTSDSAITLTLDAQATVGMESAFTKAGSGAVSVAMESGAGYWVPSDDIGGSKATAGFTITGYGYFICIRNTGGSAAEWLFVGQSSLAASINGKLELGTGGSISDNGPISATGALTKALHGGRVVLTTGNVTIPNAAGDVGMGGVIKADASRTVTFNSTSLTLAVGDVLTYYVQSTSVLIRSKRLAADEPAMA